MMIIQTILDFLLLFLLRRLMMRHGSVFIWNSHLSSYHYYMESISNFLDPVFPVPIRGICSVLFIAAALLKIILYMRGFTDPNLIINGAVLFAPLLTEERTLSFFSAFQISVFDFALFLLHLWTVYWITKLIAPRASGPSSRTDESEVFTFFTFPFSKLKPFAGFIALIGFAVVLTIGLFHTFPTPQFSTLAVQPELEKIGLSSGISLFHIIKYFWFALFLLIEGINTLVEALFVFILCTIFALIFRRPRLFETSNKSIAILMGRFHRAASGPVLDFTPVIFYYVCYLLHFGFTNILQNMLLIQLSV